MLSEAEKRAIRESWKLVVPIADTAADLFYRRLFELKPEYRTLFPDDMTAQKRKLLSMLAFVVRSLDFPESAWRNDVPADHDLMLVVLALGRRHSDLYEIPPDSYLPVGEALMWTLDYGLGDAFSDEVRDAWLRVYGLLSSAMKMGAYVIDRDATLSSKAAALRLGEVAIRSDLQSHEQSHEPAPAATARGDEVHESG